jgi:hypothetical protein
MHRYFSTNFIVQVIELNVIRFSMHQNACEEMFFEEQKREFGFLLQ